MSHARRVGVALGAGLLAAGLAAGAATAPVGASPRPDRAARAATPTSERFALVLTVTLGGQPQRVTMTGVAGPSRADLHLTAAGSHIEVRRIGATAYVHVPPGTSSPLPAGKTWGAVSVAALRRRLGVSLPGLSAPAGATSVSAAGVLRTLAGMGSGTPAKVGSARIHGIATTAYRVTVDPAKVLARLPKATRDTLGSLLGGTTASKVPVTFWQDRAGRLVQLRTGLPLQVHASGLSLSLHLGVLAQAWDFGVPVHVVRPPAAATGTLPASSLGAAALGLGGLGG